MLLFYVKFGRTKKYYLNESCRGLVDLSIDINFMNFCYVDNELCLLEVGLPFLKDQKYDLFCGKIWEKSRGIQRMISK